MHAGKGWKIHSNKLVLSVKKHHIFCLATLLWWYIHSQLHWCWWWMVWKHVALLGSQRKAELGGPLRAHPVFLLCRKTTNCNSSISTYTYLHPVLKPSQLRYSRNHQGILVFHYFCSKCTEQQLPFLLASEALTSVMTPSPAQSDSFLFHLLSQISFSGPLNCWALAV